jgi:K+-sensing histidine kinase KdpD
MVLATRTRILATVYKTVVLDWELGTDHRFQSNFQFERAVAPRFARGLQIETHILGGSHVAKTVVEFARRHQVTQIFVAHSQTRLRERLRGRNFAENIVRLAQDLQVTVAADRSRRPGS